MKNVSFVARILLGVLFVTFGFNGFLNFIPMGPAPTGLAGQFVSVLLQAHYMSVVFAIEIVSGILLLLNWHAPAALAMLAPVIVNIVLFHAFMAMAGLPLAVVVCVLWLLAAYKFRSSFAGLLQQPT